MVMLYDQFGREIRVKKKPEMREVAVAAIRDRWSTYPSQGLTPVKLATIFKQADGGDIYRQAELFEEMEEKDTHLFSQLQTRKNAVLGLDYEVAPYSDSSEDKKIAEFVNDVFYNMNDFDDSLLDLLDAIGKGYSMCEIMWNTDGRYAAIERMQWIHAKKAIFYDMSADAWKKDYEMPRIVTETEPFKGEAMPPFKLIYHRYKARSGYDTRAGILRVCAWMYLFKNYATKDWAAFTELFGMPIRLGKYDVGAGPEEKDALMTAISSLGSDAAGIISKNTEIEFVETMKGQSKENPFSVLANFADAQMSKAILGQTLTTQEGKSGSYSLGQVHDLVRHDLIKADCEALAKTIRFQIVRPLVGYNFGWDKPLPWFNFKFERPEDFKALSDTYINISKINYPLTVEHISERFKIPMPKKGETVLAPKTSGMTLKSGRVVAKQRGFSHEQENIEGLIASARDRSAQALSGLTEPVKQIIAEAGSLEEIQDRIVASYSDMDKNALADLLARAMFVAELYGRAAVAEKMRRADAGSS